MARTPKHTEAEILRALEMRERGLSIRQIAFRTGMKANTIAWWCLKQGADKNGMKPELRVYNGGRPYTRNGIEIRPFLPDEDIHLQALERRGLSLPEISVKMGRTWHSCRNRLMILARHEARLEAQAEARAA